MSIIELFLVLACGAGLLAILALGAWILINKSKQEPSASQQARLEALDKEYTEGDLDEDEYQRRRDRILAGRDDRMR